jgi:hypothetical protein
MASVISISKIKKNAVIDFNKIRRGFWDKKSRDTKIVTAKCLFCGAHGLIMNDGEMFVHKMKVEDADNVELLEYCTAPISVRTELEKIEKMLNASIHPDPNKFSAEAIIIARLKGLIH